MLQLNDPAVEEIIQSIFNSEIQQKRVRKELQGISSLGQKNYKISLQPTQISLKIIIELPEESLRELIKDPIAITFPVMFEIYLDAKFPFVSPRVHCKSDFYRPSLADGRDFIDDIVEQLWTPAILLKDVIIMLLKFVKRVNKLPTHEESLNLGKYYVDKLYDFEDFLQLGSVSIFPAHEVINDKGKSEERYLVVAESFFLSFFIQDKKTHSAKLLFHANIKSIANIKKNKENNKLLVLTFHDKSKQSGVTQCVYTLDDPSKFIDHVISIGQKYGMKVNRTIKKLQDLTLEDVTAKSYENIDIEELLEDITIFESKLENDISVDVINILMALYQKTIEYFSAFNDPAYSDFVERLHSLLQRKDVQVILQSQEDNKPQATSKSKREQKYHEDEEEKKEGSPSNQYKHQEEEEEETHKSDVFGQQNQKISLNDGNKKNTENETNEEAGTGGGIDLGDNI